MPTATVTAVATSDIIKAIGQAIIDALSPRPAGRRRPGRSTPRPRARNPRTDGYPGDFTGRCELSYDPHPGRLADPGEVVWTWVPYEEDHTRGKDRPVLVIARDGHWLLALPMTSKDHDLDAGQEASEGRYWVEIGRGSWDSSGRVSEARVNRIVRVDPEKIRRVSDRVSRDVFERVAAGVRRHW
ncbi:hypothetical protein PROP_00367 [Propionicimonas sp. T2.31MG-18]